MVSSYYSCLDFIATGQCVPTAVGLKSYDWKWHFLVIKLKLNETVALFYAICLVMPQQCILDVLHIK